MTGTNENTQTTAPLAAPAEGTSTPAATTAPTNTDAPSSSTRKDDRDAWITPEVGKAMAFDPFTPAGEELNPNTTNVNGSPAADGGANGTQPASVTQAPATNGGAPVATAPVQSEAERLLAENAKLLNAVLTTPVSPTQSAEKTANPQPKAPDIPAYDYTIPDQLIAAMSSEDPNERKKGTAMLIKGVAQGIHKTIIEGVNSQLQQLVQNLPAIITQHTQHIQQAQTVETDFYGKFPQLKHEQLRPLVAKVAEGIMKEKKQTSWTPELRDAIGAKVIELVRSAVPATAAVATPQPAAAPQPAMFGGNSAVNNPRALNSGKPTQQDHMADIL